MNKALFNTILVTAGAAIGSLVTWKVVERKYARIAQEEIDSVKEEYKRIMDLSRKEVEAYRRIKRNDATDSDGDNAEGKSVENPQTIQDDDSRNDDAQAFTEQEVIDYHNIVNKYRKISDDESENESNEEGDEEEEVEVQYIDAPYVIAPEDFCGIPGYSGEPLDYFADGVLADGWGVKLDIEETIGEDAIDHFGEYNNDVVYVRNEAKEIDYEVTRDPRTYEEALRTNPNPYYGNDD